MLKGKSIMTFRNAVERILIIALLGTAVPVMAEGPAGKITAVDGTVTIARHGRDVLPARTGDDVFLGDIVTTGKDGRVKILFESDVFVVIGEDSSLEVSEHVIRRDDSVRTVVLRLLTGTVRAILERLYLENDQVRIVSRNAIAGAKGTDFVVVSPAEDLTDVYVLKGTVEVRNADLSVAGTEDVPEGYFTRVVGSDPPLKPGEFSDAVRQRMTDSLWLVDRAKAAVHARGETINAGRGKAIRALERKVMDEAGLRRGDSPQVDIAGRDYIVPGSLSVPPSVPSDLGSGKISPGSPPSARSGARSSPPAKPRAEELF